MGQITVSKCYTEDGIEIEGLKVIEPRFSVMPEGTSMKYTIIMIMLQQV